ncbi:MULTISPECIES: hypothetical protein [Acidobacteriaceae]|uniref:hypothetical protein n=1 Tax=Acidobacteriaceae TaxID=204434 RepID=UPI00131C1D6B|nr:MULTISPECIES: hypothetical protein [Acidobacteriaceae]MDW5265586.1 hypothetical protein [Edaphobacter sp.]
MRHSVLRWVIVLFLLGFAGYLPAQRHASSQIDSDHDGLSDALEQSLLVQFAPTFMIGRHDCSDVPAEFRPGSVRPIVKAENRTIYGEVFPAKGSVRGVGADEPLVEIHFYHLWKLDCGEHPHPLDAEHVAVLVRSSDGDPASAKWTAMYWYAAAHENTVCDVSQIARASTLKAEDRGARVWVSPGKHASYLNSTLCQRGCGADRCEEMKPLGQGKLINLGEPGHPMNSALFISSSLWPLAGKMETTNFPEAAVARLNRLPETDIAWFRAGRHPVQGIIAISSSTEGALAQSGRNTTNAISGAGDSTDAAISVAEDSTGNALQKSYRKTGHALGTSAKHVGKALHVVPKTEHSDPPQ